MLKIFRKPAQPDRFAWLMERVADELPRAVLDKTLQVLEVIFDGDQPPWKRAALVCLLVELFARSGVRLPVGLLIRYTALHTLLSVRVRSDPFEVPDTVSDTDLPH